MLSHTAKTSVQRIAQSLFTRMVESCIAHPVHGSGQTATYSVQVALDLSQPVATIAPEYPSFAIDLSQRDLMV
jgi:hypothetical protein